MPTMSKELAAALNEAQQFATAGREQAVTRLYLPGAIIDTDHQQSD